jgi:hypothetical protein
MAKALTLEQAATVLVWLVLATALLFIGPRYAGHLMFAPGATAAARWLGVAISVGSLLPWFAYVAWGLSIADEYNRRTLVVGTAIAFAVAILFSIATQLMADAHLVGEVITINLPIAFLIWIAGLGGSALFFKLRGAR